MNAEDVAPATLGAKKCQISREKAIIHTRTNGEGRADLEVGFNLEAAGCRVVRKVSLP